MASVLYECASQEKMEMLPAWIEIFRQAKVATYTQLIGVLRLHVIGDRSDSLGAK